MTVLPVDLHAGAFRFVHSNLHWLDRLPGQLPRMLFSAPRLFLAYKTDSFMTHISIFA